VAKARAASAQSPDFLDRAVVPARLDAKAVARIRLDSPEAQMSKMHYEVIIETETETGEMQAVYFRVRQGKVDETKELMEGTAYAAYDRRGSLLGIELLGPCRVTALDRVIKSEPTAIRQFVKRSMPRKMAIA
jgi:hypothetical protein